jgi:hypothetical protein
MEDESIGGDIEPYTFLFTLFVEKPPASFPLPRQREVH